MEPLLVVAVSAEGTSAAVCIRATDDRHNAAVRGITTLLVDVVAAGAFDLPVDEQAGFDRLADERTDHPLQGGGLREEERVFTGSGPVLIVDGDRVGRVKIRANLGRGINVHGRSADEFAGSAIHHLINGNRSVMAAQAGFRCTARLGGSIGIHRWAVIGDKARTAGRGVHPEGNDLVIISMVGCVARAANAAPATRHVPRL